jgi:hypothetical protein
MEQDILWNYGDTNRVLCLTGNITTKRIRLIMQEKGDNS